MTQIRHIVDASQVCCCPAAAAAFSSTRQTESLESRGRRKSPLYTLHKPLQSRVVWPEDLLLTEAKSQCRVTARLSDTRDLCCPCMVGSNELKPRLEC